jgi:hypothetical protein
VRKIKQQIYLLKSSTNPLKSKAFKNNEEKVNKLLAELNTVSQKSQTVAPTEKGFFRPEVIIPIALVAVVLIAAVGIMVMRRRNKQLKVKK